MPWKVWRALKKLKSFASLVLSKPASSVHKQARYMESFLPASSKTRAIVISQSTIAQGIENTWW